MATKNAGKAGVQWLKAGTKPSAMSVPPANTVPAGHKSMAYAFVYRAADRTLTDAEVNTAQEKSIEQFTQKLQASIR